MSEGVLQGEVLSPLLFIIYISDMITFLRGRGVRGIDINYMYDVLTLVYAGDLIILAYSSIDLKRKLSILEEYGNVNGLTVNTQKTQVMVFRTAGKLGKYSENFTYNGQPVKVENKYPYLGITLSTFSLGLLPAITAANKTRVASSPVLAILATANGDSWEAIMKLFKSVGTSTLPYPAPVWGRRYTSILERAQLEFFKRLFQLPRCTPGCALRLELGISRVDLEVAKAAINRIVKVLKMEKTRLPEICLRRLLHLLSRM